LADGRDVSTLAPLRAGRRRGGARRYSTAARNGAGPARYGLSAISPAFAAVQVTPRVSVLGRVDRSFDPIPGGETIDYLPFADDAKPVFGLVGLDVTLAKTVHLIPNVEIIAYGETADGATPGTDVVPRVTLFFSW
jgi:hypothetical protein